MNDNVAKLLNALLQEEESLQFDQFTNEMALELGLKMIELSQDEGKYISIDITRNGQQLFHYALQGTSKNNDEWIKGKNRVVDWFGHSSYYMGVYYKSLQTTIADKDLLDPSLFAPLGGAFPIQIKEVGVVGTITVSGLSEEEDHQFVVRVLSDYLSLVRNSYSY